MPLQLFDQDVQNFTSSIKKALRLQADDYALIHQKKKVVAWIQEQTASLKEKRQQQKRNQGLLTGILNLAGMNETQKKLQNEQMVLQRVKDIMKVNVVNIDQSELEQLAVPSHVKQCLKRLNKQSIPDYLAVVTGPLLKGSYIKSRQGLDSCIKAVQSNGFKFTVLGSEPSNVVKHQRSLLEQLFNKLFWKESELSMVIKIQIEKENFEKSFDIYCFIEDISTKECGVLKQLGQIKTDKDDCIYVMREDRKMCVDEMSIFNCLLSQMLTVPIQTIVSDYAVAIEGDRAKLVRTHKKSEKSDISQQIKEHPSLRSPLFYFANYIIIHQFSIQSVKSMLELRHFFEDFYQILNILIDFMQKDFTIKTANGKINSLLVTHSFFHAIWRIFHEFVILSHWIEQVISPIKKTITLYEINAKIMPIFNQILKLQKGTFEEYQKLLLNFPIQNYLTMNVSKTTIQHYKDRFININTTEICPSNSDIFESIFQKTIKDYNISNINTHEVIYFFNFIGKHHSLIYKENYAGCHPSWRNRKVWKEMSQAINKDYSQIKYLSVCLEFLGFYFDFEFKKYSQHPFDSVINDEQAPRLFERIEIFTKILKQKYERKQNEYLSLLLQRSFKYGKFKVVQFLIKKGIQLVNYDEIFTNSPELSQNYDKIIQKQDTIQYMKNCQPEMFRNYQWEEFINLKMKQEKTSPTVFQTVRRGKFSLPSNLQSNFQSKNMMSNTLSRKDYMYSNNRQIGKINVKKQEVYIEMTQYPLLRYFYQFFLKKINKSSLIPNFCGFFTNTGKLIHLIQSLPNCSNYKKTLKVSCEADLAKHIDHQEISEAIIICMMLMPTNISLNNIFISYGHVNKHGLNGNYNHFLVDFHDFYQKNGFQFSAGSANLKVKNSLFLFQEMKSAVSPKLMKKYANLTVFDVINNVFKESALLVSQVNRMKKSNLNIPQQQRQLFSIIFQDDFCQSLVERMFKIQRAFDKSLRTKAMITHLQLLQIINPQLSYYYNQIIETSNKLLDRQRYLMDDGFKKSLVVNQNLINFFPNPVNTEESRNNFPNHYKKFTFQGPSQNLASFYQDILKFDIYTKKITQLGEYNQSVIEYLIKNVDFSIYQKQQRESLINKIQDYSKLYLKKENNCLPLSIIRFSNIEQLRQKNVYFSGQRLKELILEHTSCNESEMNTILRRYESMRSIIIRNVSAMQKIGDFFNSVSDTYDFKNLKYLSIVGCRDLLNINLKCEQLQQVTLRKNPLLTEVYVLSKKLKDMDCYQCPKLRLENIGIYILKKVNVLLSPTCCEGQVLKLQDKDYSIFLTKILLYLLNCFEQSKTYKLELIMTLIRLELIDEKLLGLKHNQIYNKNMASTLAKLGLEALDIAVSQIFDIFLRNDLVEVLNFDDLLKINVDHLTIIDDYFTKVLKMKENSWYNYRRNFTSLIFKGFNRFKEGANQYLKFVKTLLTLIDIDKTLQFHLSISNDNCINGYSELINLLNKRADLQNLYLKISNNTISNHFMKYLFTLEGPRNRICKIQFSNCNLKVDHKVVIGLSCIKSLIFTECMISYLDFIENFTFLTNLQLNSCKFDHEIVQVYDKVGKLKSLLNLSIINIKRSLKDGKLHLSILFENLMKLAKLQYFDFSDNQLDKDEISYFSAQIHKVKIYQLNLYNFHEDGLNEYINFFLYHESIKIIGIQFKLRSIKFFEAFIDNLSHNTSIVKLNLKTDQQFETKHFQKIKNNIKLEAIQSNHPIPNSIKNHINNMNDNSISAILSEQSFESDRSSRDKNEDYCRIGLSLDGGGARGLLSATSMDYISRKVGKPLHKIFDYIGGTSIGGILALASTGTSDGNTPICSSQQLMDIFQIYGDSIFKKTQFSNIVSLFETKYDIRGCSDMLYGYFKETKLSDVLKGTNVVVNAVNRHTNEDVIFRSINAIFDRNQDFYMKDVALATSAAPIYFPSAQIKNVNASVSYSLIDGGVGLNNPSKLVIDDIIKITQNQAHKKNYFLLSLGTGKLRNEAVPANAGIKDIAPIIDSLTISANYFLEKDLSENYRGHYLRVSPYLDMDRKDSQLDNTTPETYNAYKQFALDAAQENYSSTIAFGKFKNQSFIEWLRENTDRKQETR